MDKKIITVYASWRSKNNVSSRWIKKSLQSMHHDDQKIMHRTDGYKNNQSMHHGDQKIMHRTDGYKK